MKMKNSILFNKMAAISCMIVCLLSFSTFTANAFDFEVVKTEYTVRNKTILVRKYIHENGKVIFSYSIKEFSDSIKTIEKTRRSVFSKDPHIYWTPDARERLPKLKEMFYLYADDIFSIGDPKNYLYGFSFFVYDTGGVLIDNIQSGKDLVDEGYKEEILDFFEKVQTFRFPTPVVSNFDTGYFIDGLDY
jgi:hypothetical protein